MTYTVWINYASATRQGCVSLVILVVLLLFPYIISAAPVQNHGSTISLAESSGTSQPIQLWKIIFYGHNYRFKIWPPVKPEANKWPSSNYIAGRFLNPANGSVLWVALHADFTFVEVRIDILPHSTLKF